MLYILLNIVKHITDQVALILAWPEPEPLWSNGTPSYWVSLESIARTINTLYWDLKVGISKKREEVVRTVPRTANYLRFLTFFVSFCYALAFLMPQLLLRVKWQRGVKSWGFHESLS